MPALIALSLGYLLVTLDATAVSVVSPSLGADLGGGVGTLQWVLDAYTLVFAALLLSAGTIGDRIGPRRTFAAGLVLFALASAACGAAPSAGALIAARAVQGVGAALLVPSSLALLRERFPGRAEQARALGVWGGVGGVGAAGGPLLGGLLAGTVGWRAVFLLNLPVAAVAAALLARHVAPDRLRGVAAAPHDRADPPAPDRPRGVAAAPHDRADPPAPDRPRGVAAAPHDRADPPAPDRPRDGRSTQLDLPGQLAAVAGCALLTLGLIEAGERGWSDPAVIAALVLAVLSAVAFALRERRARAPMLPPSLVRRPAVAGGSAVGLLINLGFYGQLFLTTLLFQQQRGYGVTQAGLALLPAAAAAIAGSLAAGRLTAARGARTAMVAGLTLGAGGLTALALLAPAAPYVALAPALTTTGFGMALTMPAATAAVLGAAPPALAGTAAGTLNAARQLGGTVGVALLGSVAGATLAAADVRAALLVAALAFAAGVAVTLAAVARSPVEVAARRVAGSSAR
jgi:DHA2 family methylenomycin A resistance protein-like MFS transporter